MYFTLVELFFLKVSKFKNEFMKALFLQKYEPYILRIFWEKRDFINSF